MKIEVEQVGHETKSYFIKDGYRDMVLMVLAHFQLSEEPRSTIQEVLGQNA